MMKTTIIFLTTLIWSFFYSQQIPPSKEWSQTYFINNTYPSDIVLDNNNVITFLAQDIGTDNQTRVHLVKTNNTIISDQILKVGPNDEAFNFLINSDNTILLVNIESFEKYDPSGTLIWNKTFESNFYLNGGIKTIDNQFVIFGSREVDFDADYLYRIRKLDQAGNTVWNKEGQKINNKFFAPNAMLQTSDGGFLCGGVYGESISTNQEGYSIIKLDSTGNLLWEKRFPISTYIYSNIDKIIACDDGNFIMYGFNDVDTGAENVNSFYTKFDATGNVIWTKTTQTGTYISAIVKGLDNGYVLLKDSNLVPDQVTLEKITESGTQVWNQDYPNIGNSYGIIPHNSGFVSISDLYSTTLEGHTANIVRFGQLLSTSDYTGNSLQIYPNPATSILNFKLTNSSKIQFSEIFDSSGRLIKTFNSAIKNLDIADLKTGHYTLKITSSDGVHISKFIKK